MPAVGGCASGTVIFTALAPGTAIAAVATVAITLPNSVAMLKTAAGACRGAEFAIPVTAAAAWQTAAPGPAQAKAGRLQSPAPITCTGRHVSWSPAGDPVQYRVWFNDGNKPDLVTSETAAAAPGSGFVSVRVQTFVESWTAEAAVNKICS